MNGKYFLLIILTVVLLTKVTNLQAQTKDTFNLFSYNIEELTKIKVNVGAADTNYSANITPYIVTVITKEEIENSGARDLMEILRLVPGIEFGTDVVGQVGILVQGIWANEGKVILMIDGNVLNEDMYGTLQFGYHYPIENIERIEIIRGSGSIFYGSYAELMVINIITKDYSKIGNEFGVSFGATKQKFGFETGVYSGVGKEFDENTSLSVFARIINGYRSDKIYYDIYSDSYNLLENRLSNTNVNFKFKSKIVNINALFDAYLTTTKDYFGENLSYAYPKNFYTSALNFFKDYRISPKLTLLPSLKFKYSKPWNSPLPRQNPLDSSYYSLNQSIITINPDLIASFHIKQNFDINFGFNFYYYYAIDKSPEPQYFWNNAASVSLQTLSFFAEMNYFKPDLFINTGLRYEYNFIYGGAFVPRFSITKTFGSHSLKFIYNRAFRPPTIANITFNYPLYQENLYPIIKPELSDILNMELSLLFMKHFYVILTGFYNQTHNAITYFVDSQGNEGYANITKLGTKGLEIQLKYTSNKFYSFLTLSYYVPVVTDTLYLYKPPQIDWAYLGAPNYKLTFYALYNFRKKLYFNLQAIYLSNKYGYYLYDSAIDDLNLVYFDPTVIINTSLSYKTKKIEFDFGVYNLLDKTDYLVQPYKGWHAPLIGKGLILRFGMKYNF